MTTLLGVPIAVFMGQLTLGLVNGAFYALLSLGLAVIFGLLKIVNFAHGAQYMLGAFAALLSMRYFGTNYWAALVLVPLVIGGLGMLLERFLLRRIAHLDHLYGLLLTFGLALIFEGTLVNFFGVSGARYATPEALQGGLNLGFMFLPTYRAWVLVAALGMCLFTWFMIERTRLGAYLRAGTENAALMQAFGVNVPLLVTLTYGFGVGLAAFAGVLAAPLYPVSPTMGSSLLIVVFAVVVIGGMGSILGAIVTGLAMGVIEGLTKVYYPEAANTVIFLVMILVLLLRPAGLFGKEA
ncbi:branched-chain amino acid ABC transporter permease [Halomonas dongshanensis]|uniref:Branched-chain amino acid ABC transporter permease n=1 Tax=Halomonas dongshanensis TaxID=2890835 RepID=A0ABT2EEX4_9GAMM|nr:branched-chain amino acid ABC transporter permease [Halomonas dongshanensis]MCS2610131.1 branched-chain amino acid ABC transporter permease [Halomonas dongshanensis]